MAQNGAPGGGWPPPSSAVPPKRREGVTSALEELADATRGSDALASGDVRPEYVPLEKVSDAPALSAVAEQASLIEGQAGSGMTPEELAAFRAGVARKAAEVAAAPALVEAKTPKKPRNAPVRTEREGAVAPTTPSQTQGMTFAEERAAARTAVLNASPSTTGTSLRMDAAMARAEILRSAPATEGETIAESYARAREGVRTAPESADPLGPSVKDATHKENVEALRRSLSEKLTGEKKVEGAESTAADLYEMRVSAFAQANGLGAEFAAMRAARDAYREARMKVPSKGAAKSVKRAYDEALFNWRTELHTKSLQTEGRTRAEALIFAKRDTILGPAQVEQEARYAALNEKGKTAYGKMEKWVTRAPLSLLKLTNKPFELVGKGAAMVLHKEGEAREAYAKRYARAARILAGAGFATAMAMAASPIAVPGALLTFAVYGARGTIGTLAGMGAAKLSGGLFDRLFGNKQKENIKAQMHTRPLTIEQYQDMQERYRKQNAAARSKQRMAAQMLGAMVGGAGTGLLTSPLAHTMLEQMGALKATEDAARTLADANAHSPEAATHAMRVAAKAAEHPASVSAPAPIETSAGTPSHADVPPPALAPLAGAGPSAPSEAFGVATVGKGEGFGELVQHFKQGMPAEHTSSSAIDHVLKSDPNAIAREVAALRGDASAIMRPGDQLFADSSGHVWFRAQGHEAQMLFENKPSAPGGYVHHEFRAIDTPADHVGNAAPVAPSEDPTGMLSRMQTMHAPSEPLSVIQEQSLVQQEGMLPHGSDLHQMPHIKVRPFNAAEYDAAHPAAPTASVEHVPTAPAHVEAPESAPVHPFASPDAAPQMNEHGVDLNKPQIVMSDGKLFARGTSTEDSYERAMKLSLKLASEHKEDTRVYFVARDIDDLGRPYLSVRVMFTPPNSAPQMAPYGEGVTPIPGYEAPPVPKDSSYQPLPR